MANEGVGGAAPTTTASPAVTARRRFLARLSLVLGAIGSGIVGLPTVGFLLGPLVRRAPLQWREIGRVEQYSVGQTVEALVVDPSPLAWAGLASRTAIWLRREGENDFVAFSVNCTHLGCPVRWLQGANLFMCPCHGGVFYSDGTVAAGPPRKPLVRYPARVRGGSVEVLSGVSPIIPEGE